MSIERTPFRRPGPAAIGTDHVPVLRTYSLVVSAVTEDMQARSEGVFGKRSFESHRILSKASPGVDFISVHVAAPRHRSVSSYKQGCS